MSEDHSEINVPDLIEAGSDVLSGLPPMARRSFWKIVQKLGIALADIPVALLESRAGSIRTRQQAKNIVLLRSAAAVAAQFETDPALTVRALEFHAKEIITEQSNREKIVGFAHADLKENPPLEDSAEEVSDDLIDYFFKSTSFISDEEIQKHLGKILAGEIRRPGKLSRKAILALTTMETATALDFQKLCNLAFHESDHTLVFIEHVALDEYEESGNCLQEFGLGFMTLSNLEAEGLIISAFQNTSGPLSEFINSNEIFEFSSKTIFFKVKDQSRFTGQQRYRAIVFTSLGCQLYKIMSKSLDKNFALRLINYFEKLNVSIYIAPEDRESQAGLRSLADELSF